MNVSVAVLSELQDKGRNVLNCCKLKLSLCDGPVLPGRILTCYLVDTLYIALNLNIKILLYQSGIHNQNCLMGLRGAGDGGRRKHPNFQHNI